MNPRDIGTKSVLLVGSSGVESMDLTDHLTSIGWDQIDDVASTFEATRLLDMRAPGYGLIVLAGAYSNEDGASLLARCRADELPVLVINGTESSKDDPLVSVMSRPFMADDMTRALARLGIRPI